MLPPHRRGVRIDRPLEDRIIGHLVTRFGGTVPRTRLALQHAEVDEWAKVRIANDGDTLRSSTFASVFEDRRDATYVRVSGMLVFLEVTYLMCY